jgi:hypothetical protein
MTMDGQTFSGLPSIAQKIDAIRTRNANAILDEILHSADLRKKYFKI